MLDLLNETFQSPFGGLGYLLFGTTEFLEDSRRGLYSNQALRTRLAPPRFAATDLVDYSAPVIKQKPILPEEQFVLLKKIRHVHASGCPDKCLIDDAGIAAVLKESHKILGAQAFASTREITRKFVTLLNLLEQHPGSLWQDIVSQLGSGIPSGISANSHAPREKVEAIDF